MKIHPFDERVVIEVKEPEEKKVGGLILPDSVKEKPQAGVVVSVGDGEEISKMVKEGDLVIFNKYSGNEYHLDGSDFIILDKDDVLGKIV
jgi:chaperonin GroES